MSEDTDYIELTKAEEMVQKGQDPRLQALRKRLQAKKELLKQLDRMYSSYMGGSAAASESGGGATTSESGGGATTSESGGMATTSESGGVATTSESGGVATQ